uniref:Uncharacterized protein n=1 Tax=Arundo donax TaxID=35708 RepID=A0A0A9AGN1_ARUDO
MVFTGQHSALLLISILRNFSFLIFSSATTTSPIVRLWSGRSLANPG